MKKRILHIASALIVVGAMVLPSCELLQDCGFCTLITVDNDGIVTEGAPQWVCDDKYLEYKDSEITYTIDGSQYWDCE